MKALFLIFHGFDKANGISKKIHYQVKALKECGVDARLCYYDITPHCERRLMIDNEVIADFGTGTTAKVWKRIYYAPIIKYARREKIEFVYIRSAHNANPFTLRLVKHLKSIGAKVVMEIPTYPYDQEYITRSMKLSSVWPSTVASAIRWPRSWTVSSLSLMPAGSSEGKRYASPTE